MKLFMVRVYDRISRGPWLRLAAALIMIFGVVPDRVVASFGHDGDDLSGLIAMARAMGIDDELEPEERAALARHFEIGVRQIRLQQSIEFDRHGEERQRNEALSIRMQVFVDEEALIPIALIGHLIMEAETDGGERLKDRNAEVAVRNLEQQLEHRHFFRLFKNHHQRQGAFRGQHQEDLPRFSRSIGLTAPKRRASRFDRFRGVLFLALSDGDLVDTSLGPVEEIEEQAVVAEGLEHHGAVRLTRRDGELELRLPVALASHLVSIELRDPDNRPMQSHAFRRESDGEMETRHFKTAMEDGSSIHLRAIPGMKFLMIPFSWDGLAFPGPDPIAWNHEAPGDGRWERHVRGVTK